QRRTDTGGCMSYESWRISFQSSEQAARAAYAEAKALREEAAGWKCVAAAHAELHAEAEERAERLAEALRNIAAMRWWCGEDLKDATGAARDALAQEGLND